MADFARGDLLKRLRDQRHLSQEDAAYEIGVSAKSYRSWEHGGPIRWANAKRLGEFYGLDPEGLVSRELPPVLDEEEIQGILELLRQIDAKVDALLRAVAPDVAARAATDAALPTARSSDRSAPKRAAIEKRREAEKQRAARR